MPSKPLCRGLLASAAMLLAPLPLPAAPDEIQVYTEETNDLGQFGVELHLNHAIRGAREPAYPGEKPSHRMFQATPEFSYGITKSLEAGLYVPFALDPQGNAYGNGLRARLKYIAPRDEGEHFFWGLNTEVGYSTRRVSESHWGMELRPIVGYRTENWLVSFNPILDVSLSANVSRRPNFEPSLKVTRKALEGLHAGLEYYGEFGPLSHPLPSGERAHTLYAVMDIESKGLDINIGIGHGFQGGVDKRVVKAIVAFPFK